MTTVSSSSTLECSPTTTILTVNSTSVITRYRKCTLSILCAPNLGLFFFSTIGCTPSVTMYPSVPKPVSGQGCSNEGLFMCSSKDSFAQCVFSQWIVRNCTSGTICRETYDTTPPSIYCGFA
jgi:hypothetical protein